MKNRKVTIHSMAHISFLKVATKLGGRGGGVHKLRSKDSFMTAEESEI